MSSPSVSDSNLSVACSTHSPSEQPPSGSVAGFAPVELSAQRLHELAIQAFRTGNRGRLSLCEALRVLDETHLFFDLGFPSLVAYADAFFQLRRSETFEHVRVAKALVELTELRETFGEGRIGWSSLKAITRVTSVESQAEWIEFARLNGVERTLAEARDALRQHRDRPRDSSFGLPNLEQKLVLRFSRSDMEKVRAWLESNCVTVAETTGSEEVSLEQAVLYLCERDAARGADSVGSAKEGSPRGACRTQIVYQCCPDCGRSRVGTRDGFVEVTPEEVERYQGSAEQVVLDGPTPPALRRRILAREAGRCGNPRCGNPADHCHHIVFRSQGCKTDLANEVAVCATCHALVHAGLLRVSGDANADLLWSAIACGDSLVGGVMAGRAVSHRLPVLQLVKQSAIADSGETGEGESANADSAAGVVNRDDLAQGLKRLGVPAARSRQLIDAAVAALPSAEISEESVLRRAIRSI